jgi:Na+-transporting NADH:ubiquinone oxidoreductase subunit NqrA
MKLRGGYCIAIKGRPEGTIEPLPDPDRLLLPLRTPRLAFSQMCVADGQRVARGQVLARDMRSYGVPLLAPRGGTVRLDRHEGHIVLEDLADSEEHAAAIDSDEPLHAPPQHPTEQLLRRKLLAFGAWQYVYDALTGEVACPQGVPQAVIVSTMRMEPYLTRGDVQLKGMLPQFTRGLEHLQSLLEYQPIHLVLPHGSSELGRQVREAVRGYAFVKTVEIPRRYPFDNFALLGRRMGLRLKGAGPVWGLHVEGVLAVDRVLTSGQPVDRRLVTIGGPAALEPKHFSVLAGHPLEELLASRVDESGGAVRIVSGGILTGRTVGTWTPGGGLHSAKGRGDHDNGNSEDGQGDDAPVLPLGLDSESGGLSLLYEHQQREFLGFMRPGADRRSFSNCFLSALRLRPRPEPLTTALKGERRPCVTCGFCEEVCPARIMPHVLHKLIFQDDLEAAAKARLDLCIACGLCSYVCPSKLELAEEFQRTRRMMEEELREIGQEGGSSELQPASAGEERA